MPLVPCINIEKDRLNKNQSMAPEKRTGVRLLIRSCLQMRLNNIFRREVDIDL